MLALAEAGIVQAVFLSEYKHLSRVYRSLWAV